MMKVITKSTLKKGETIVAWQTKEDETYLEQGSLYPHRDPSGIACRDFQQGEILTEEEVFYCENGLIKKD